MIKEKAISISVAIIMNWTAAAASRLCCHPFEEPPLSTYPSPLLKEGGYGRRGCSENGRQAATSGCSAAEPDDADAEVRCPLSTTELDVLQFDDDAVALGLDEFYLTDTCDGGACRPHVEHPRQGGRGTQRVRPCVCSRLMPDGSRPRTHRSFKMLFRLQRYE